MNVSALQGIPELYIIHPRDEFTAAQFNSKNYRLEQAPLSIKDWFWDEEGNVSAKRSLRTVAVLMTTLGAYIIYSTVLQGVLNRAHQRRCNSFEKRGIERKQQLASLTHSAFALRGFLVVYRGGDMLFNDVDEVNDSALPFSINRIVSLYQRFVSELEDHQLAGKSLQRARKRVRIFEVVYPFLTSGLPRFAQIER